MSMSANPTTNQLHRRLQINNITTNTPESRPTIELWIIDYNPVTLNASDYRANGQKD